MSTRGRDPSGSNIDSGHTINVEETGGSSIQATLQKGGYRDLSADQSPR